jgi:hypothetical protein
LPLESNAGIFPESPAPADVSIAEIRVLTPERTVKNFWAGIVISL